MEETCYDQNPSTQDSYEDEVLDTLSLSDLLICDDSGNPQDVGVDDQNPNLDADDQFEFSSELLNESLNDNIVFCGKVIPYKEASVPQSTHKLESKKQQKRHKRRWRFGRFFKKSRSLEPGVDSRKLNLKYDVPIRRVSILASTTKSRWYLFMFGFGSSRFPTNMHIRDLKKRQASIGTKGGTDKRISGGNGGGGSGGGMRSWGLVRFLGCGGDDNGTKNDKHHPNVLIKII